MITAKTNPTTVVLLSLVTSLVSLPATTYASETQTIGVNQTARRTVGRCTYEARIEGHYETLPAGEHGVPVREALVNVNTRLECRGAPPKLSLRQIYFASTTEDELMNRLAEATHVDNPGSRDACGFAPALSRVGRTLLITDIVASCIEPRRGTPVAAASARAHTR